MDQSGTQAVSEVARRIQIVAEELITYVDSKGSESPFAGHMWFVKSIFQIFFEEMKGQDDGKLAMWLGQFGVLLEWCGTGNNSVLPSEVLDYLRMHHPELVQPAIEAGSIERESV